MTTEKFLLKVIIKVDELDIPNNIFYIGNRKSLKLNQIEAKRFSEDEVNKFTYMNSEFINKFILKNKIYQHILRECFDVEIKKYKLISNI
jgi:hypothetical protein